jgi:cytochrome c biogenesis protein CcmG, thiol:disulfide interchange protein DsbE
MTRTLAAFSIALLTLATAPAHATALQPAPNVALVDADGHAARLSDLAGRVVLVDFWASWCVPCRTSFPALDALYRELGPKGLVVVAVNVDEQRRNADAFLSARPHTMRVAFDPKGEAARAFALQAMPSAVIIDRAGRIRHTHMGYTEKTVVQYRSEVLELLGEAE